MVSEKLISLDAVIRKLEDEIRNECPPVDPEDPPFEAFQKKVIPKIVQDVINYLKSQPIVDAVEVVRCDDCIHYRPPDEGDYLGLCTSGMVAVSNGGEIYPGRGFYCLYGERKNDVKL